MTRKQILAFLKKEVPGEAGKLNAWRKEAAKLGPLAAPICLHILRHGAQPRHYSALLALRELGFDAYQQGHGSASTYHLKAPGSRVEQVVNPSHKMPDLPPASAWAGSLSKPSQRTSVRPIKFTRPKRSRSNANVKLRDLRADDRNIARTGT
jgi:hypothetical protein